MVTGTRMLSRKESKFYMAFLYVAFISLLVGGLMGLLQTLVRSGKFTLPFEIGYYQILTVHGVILALVMTTFFISLMGKTTGISDKQLKVGWLSFRVTLRPLMYY